MRRNVKNKKVLRAITIGLAAVLSVTSTPLPVFAAEGDNVGSNNESTSQSQGETTDPVTVDSALDDADKAATTAEGYTGTLNDEATPATGTGTVGTSVANALNTVASGEAAVTAGNDLYKAAGEVEGVVDNLLSDGKPSSNGVAQIKKAEGLEGEAEKKFGVELNADGTVKNQEGLDKKVSDANEAIVDAGNAKQDAYNALAGKDGVQDKVNTANGLITTAEGKKSTADTDTTAANEAIEDKTTGKDALENATQEKLKSIETTLNAAVVEKDIAQAVSAAVGASTDALRIVNDNLEIADKAYQQAKDAADDAVTNISSYNRQQMINLATTAQNAANDAKAAATAANKAMEALDTQETAAKTALTNAQTALTTAQNEAIKVLKDYKSGLDAINAKISTANGSRSEAQGAMKAANEAIDAAINLLGDTTDTSVTGAQAKIKAMNEAIETANTAIEKVTGLMYASGATKDEKKDHFFGDAEETCKNAQIRLTGNGKNFIDQADKLAKAREAYDKVIDAKGEVAANKDAADAAVKEIDKLINGEGNIYDKYIADVDKDINDLKALLSTGGQYSYSYFEDTAERLNTGLSQSSDDLVAANKSLGGSEEDQNLTADQIVAKYNKAVSDNEALDTTLSSLNGDIAAQQEIIKNCNNEESGANGLKAQAEKAQSDVIGDYTAMRDKYVFEVGSDGKAEFEMKDGKYVYSDEYLQLLKDSKEVTPDKYEYVNGSSVLTEKDADYKSGDSLYKKAGTPTVVDGTPANIPESDITTDGRGWLQKDLKDGKLVETEYYTYDKTITDTNKSVDIGDWTDMYLYPYGAQSNPTDKEAAKKEILRSLLGGNKLMNANLTLDDIQINDRGVNGYSVVNVTIKPNMTTPGRIPEGGHEEHYLRFKIQINKIYANENGWVAKYKAEILETSAELMGKFTIVRTSDVDEYKLTNTGGKETEKAKKAKEDLIAIDSSADAAKDNLDGHLAEKARVNGLYDKLKNDRGTAAKKLYGESMNPDKPDADSLLDQKSKADATYQANQTIINALGSTVSEYNTVLYCKGIADANLKAVTEFDINKATDISKEDKDKYNSAVEARGRVATAKANANGYLKKLTDELSDLSDNILSSKNGVAKYEEVNGKVVTAQGRLTTVRKKLDTLKSLQQAAVGNLSTTSVDDKIAVDNKTVEILALNNTLKDTLAELKKYNLDDYNALAYVRPELREIGVTIKSEDATTADEKKNVELLNMDYLGTVRKTLAAAINSATEIIERENGNLSEIAGAREILSGQLEKLNKFATDAQTEADRAATALKNWRAPYVPGDDDDDEESSTDAGIIYTNQGVTITGLDLTAIGAGTGTGIRAVAGARTGVAGVRAEADIQNPQVPLAGSVSTNSNTTTAANGEETTANIGDNLVPLAEAPFEKGTEMNLAWLLSLAAAAAAGVGVYAYDRKRKLANAEEEAKKYKK